MSEESKNVTSQKKIFPAHEDDYSGVFPAGRTGGNLAIKKQIVNR